MRHRIEYFPAWLLAKSIGLLPRPLARSLCVCIGLLTYAVYSRLRRVGMRNLEIAFPAMPTRERKKTLRHVYANIGRQLAEFCLLPRYNAANISAIAGYDGFENFAEADARGKGVIFLTAHFGGWEIGSFFHSLQGHPLNIVIRPLDNPYLNAMVEETVGILMDTNMTPPQGEFVDFFGVPACTATGMARVAIHTGAAVVPAFTIWDKDLRKYRIRFDPALKLIDTGDREADVLANTAAFNKVIEGYIRRYPEQWLWVHRRWKTRPPGEKAMY